MVELKKARSLLTHAIQENDTATIEQITDCDDFDIDEPIKNKMTPLMLAADYGNQEVL